jgi:hypothetical protein
MPRLVSIACCVLVLASCTPQAVDTEKCGSGSACAHGKSCVAGVCRAVCNSNSDCSVAAGQTCVEGNCTGGDGDPGGDTGPDTTSRAAANVLTGGGRLTGGTMTFDVQIGGGVRTGPATGAGGLKLEGGGAAHPAQRP